MTVVVATQVTAVATAVLAAGAIVTAVFAILAFKKQSTEVSTLERQARDQTTQLSLQQQQFSEQREVNSKQTEVLALQAEELRASIEARAQDAAERLRAQATQVFIWEERPWDVPPLEEGKPSPQVVDAVVRNASDQPIYDVTLTWHQGSAPWGDPEALGTVMPDQNPPASSRRYLPADLPKTVDPHVYGAVVFFRDAAGHRWRARPDGQLDEV